MAIIQEMLQKDFFFDEATYKKSQKTLINTTSQLETLQMTHREYYAQWRHNRKAPSRVFWAHLGNKLNFSISCSQIVMVTNFQLANCQSQIISHEFTGH